MVEGSRRNTRRISEQEWKPYSSHALMFLHQPGVHTWWELRKSAFSPQFRDFLERSITPEGVSLAAIHDVHANARAAAGDDEEIGA